jgi:hypothetical protein
MPVPPWEWRKAGLVPKFGGERPWPYGAATPAAAATPEEMRIRVHLAVNAAQRPAIPPRQTPAFCHNGNWGARPNPGGSK